jgi:hypothetical protein
MRRSNISGRRSRSHSPSSRGHSQAASLITLCITILSSVISEDCRFQISSPRPSKPPNALQSVCLDIAQFLAHVHSNEPSIISQIAFAVLPAFGTFRSEMHPRLLSFFDSVILRGVFEDLNRIRGHVFTDMPGTFSQMSLNNGEFTNNKKTYLSSVMTKKTLFLFKLKWPLTTKNHLARQLRGSLGRL